MIDALNEMALNSSELHEEVEFLIDDFLPKKMITMFYADGGNGKTWLSYAVASYVCDNRLCKAVYYLDFDNPIVTLKERNVDNLLINRYSNLKYIQRSKLQYSPIELISGLSEAAVAHAYDDMLFIIDSIRNLDDIKDDKKAMRLMEMLMNIREAGGTILLVHHANKDGKNYEGSNNIKNSLDCMFKLTKLPSSNGFINLGLDTKKERGGIKDCAFCVEIETLTLEPTELEVASMNIKETDFVEKIQKLLKQNLEGLNQTALLEGIGKSKDDKTVRAMLDKFEDRYYKKDKQGRKYIYFLL